MARYTVRQIDAMETTAHGHIRRAAAELGIESFGMQVLEFPPGFDRYPEHDHSGDDMEEVYVVLSGSAEFQVDGRRVVLDPERILRVAPAARRRCVPGEEGVRMLALGGIPGRPYQRPAWLRLGAPDPTTEPAVGQP
ncbi:MAG TPA: cupin domain-containing protein [Actinomycetota bacterium]|nr:cupin domain-containing protein [Actinomycetota bacterium]